jgi:hypothetical protein
MPSSRQNQKGSFAGHFDELVKHFPEYQPEEAGEGRHERSRRLQEMIDIHSLLFERAWQVERPGNDGNGI